MLIRKASIEDSRRISYLIYRNVERVKENNYTPAQIKAWKKANTPKAIEKSMEKRIIFCAFQNDKLVGTIALDGNEVVGLYVSFTKRKMGIGGILLQHLENFAHNKYRELVLSATPSARRFYEKRGYKAVRPIVSKVRGVDFAETFMKKCL